MKFLILFLLNFSLAFEFHDSPTSPHELFLTQAKSLNLTFENREDFLQKREIFASKLRKFQNHNKDGKKSFKLGFNKISFYTREEARNFLTGLNPAEGNFKGNFGSEHKKIVMKTFVTPQNFSWVEKMAVTPVQDQGECGSCYAFAAIAALESQILIKYKNATKLSEQEAMECTGGCDGGHPDQVFTYSRVSRGCTSDKEYPYKAEVLNSCSSLKSRSRVKNSRALRFKHVEGKEENILYYLANKGPMAVGMAVYLNFIDYQKGIYDDRGSDEDFLGYHAVLLAGYGVENGKKFWLVKNSWCKQGDEAFQIYVKLHPLGSEDWGEKGYFKIIRGKDFCEFESLTISYPEI